MKKKDIHRAVCTMLIAVFSSQWICLAENVGQQEVSESTYITDESNEIGINMKYDFDIEDESLMVETETAAALEDEGTEYVEMFTEVYEEYSEEAQLQADIDKSVNVGIDGQNIVLNANHFMDGDIYVAFYNGSGKLNSLKKYSPNSSNINVTADENAAYAKVMWLKDMKPNCEVQKIKLKDQYSVTYYVDSNDNYLKSIDIENPNPDYYFTENGLYLQDLMVDGYNFVGWYTAQTGGERVTSIAPGETGNKRLYAHWEKVEYTIQFASDMVPLEDMTYTTGEEKALPKPILDKYTFVGWSDKDGKIWTSIPAGTAGNITLYANWASNRNRAEAVKQLGEPIICEDSENGLILFTYEIGQIKNVPLYTTLRLNCANGLISTIEKTKQEEISQTDAKMVAQTISNSTTNSSTWTFESNWNNTTEVSQSYLDQTNQTREEAETLAKNESNTYNLTNSNGGSESLVKSNNTSFKLSGNQAHSDTTSVETGQNFGLSVDGKYYNETTTSLSAKLSAGLSAGLKIPLKGSAEGNIGGNVSGELGGSISNKQGFEIGVGVDYGAYVKNGSTGTDSWSESVDFERAKSKTQTSEKTWNTTEGFSASSSTSQSKSISNAISKLISQQYGYGESYSEGGSNSQAQDFASTNATNDEYSSTVTFFNSKIETTTESFSSNGNTMGDYRFVMAGTVHVFAIIGYDIANKAYFTYTYNVLDESTEEYLDYSFDGTFNDYETSVIPFEIPSFVNDYVNSRIAYTEGIQIDVDTGIIEGYYGDEDNEIIVIPSYVSIENNDGTYSSIKVKGIAPGLFRNNTNIVGVSLGNFINEIPAYTFEGCTSLKEVICPNVSIIGDNAFNGCSALSEFTIPSDVKIIGKNAFVGVPEIKSQVISKDIAQTIASSGAENIVLDISTITEEADNMHFEVGEIERFELLGKDKEYKGLSVKSDATETVINGVTFTENTKIPMELSSEKVTLDRVTVDCDGYALVLKADNTDLKLNRTINLMSSSENAVVTKNVNLSNLNSSIVGKLNLTGNMLVCGAVDKEKYVTFNNGEIIYITDEEYENYITSHSIYFDANGGTVAEKSKIISLSSEIGSLPKPSRDYYTFVGWYTEAEGGEEITEKTTMTSLTDITVYAHWTKNDVSAWVLSENAPKGAEIVDTKYTYMLTSYTTSGSSSLAGWTKYDSTYVWGDWSGWINYDPGTNNGNREIQTQWVAPTYQTRWTYNRYINNAGTLSTDQYASGYTNYQSIDIDYRLNAYSETRNRTRYGAYDGGYGTYLQNYWWNEGSYQKEITPGYTQWKYRDKIYTYYYKKDENKESATYPEGDNISNIQEWVQYITK